MGSRFDSLAEGIATIVFGVQSFLAGRGKEVDGEESLSGRAMRIKPEKRFVGLGSQGVGEQQGDRQTA